MGQTTDYKDIDRINEKINIKNRKIKSKKQFDREFNELMNHDLTDSRKRLRSEAWDKYTRKYIASRSQKAEATRYERAYTSQAKTSKFKAKISKSKSLGRIKRGSSHVRVYVVREKIRYKWGTATKWRAPNGQFASKRRN